MSPKHSSLAFDDIKEQALVEEFVPELNVIINPRHKLNEAFLRAAEQDLAVEVKGTFTVSF